MARDKNTKAVIEASPVNIPSVLRHQAPISKLGSLVQKKTSAPSLKDTWLVRFQAVEQESALALNRQSLEVELSDGINWPFRTKAVDDNTTVIQVSSAWIKQHNPESILESFRLFCDRGHLVDETVQSHFDSTFKRPGYIYTCPGCGAQFTTSYKLVKEATTRGCIPCGIPASQMHVTKA